jgi:hypothetical protein
VGFLVLIKGPHDPYSDGGCNSRPHENTISRPVCPGAPLHNGGNDRFSARLGILTIFKIAFLVGALQPLYSVHDL